MQYSLGTIEIFKLHFLVFSKGFTSFSITAYIMFLGMLHVFSGINFFYNSPLRYGNNIKIISTLVLACCEHVNVMRMEETKFVCTLTILTGL